MALTVSWQEEEERSAPCRKVVTCGGAGGEGLARGAGGARRSGARLGARLGNPPIGWATSANHCCSLGLSFYDTASGLPGTQVTCDLNATSPPWAGPRLPAHGSISGNYTDDWHIPAAQ